jgi:methionyl aminopeptidase
VDRAALWSLREAGRVAAAARAKGAALIRPGAGVREVCEAVEHEILRRGARTAFPTQSSRNDVAAHHCPGPDDDTPYAEGDLAKLDIGVHVNGWVVDTALTVNVGDRPENGPFVQATRTALAAAVALAGPGVEVRRISAVIEQAIRGFGLRPMQSLCGHGVGRWIVHGPPPIPNSPDETTARLEVDTVVAIEPFATDGPGVVAERAPAEVFRLDPRHERADGLDAEVFAAIRDLRGLPFARRQLAAFPRESVEATLAALRARGLLTSYPPLVESTGRKVAQTEHTLLIRSDGVEVLTR